jgi:hypothetical protein
VHSAQRPYGFLSYGRAPHQGSERRPEEPLRRFFDRLTEDLMELTDLDAKIPAVYLDQRIPVGSTWEDELKLRLARCQVFVPLLSRRLFSSEWCALEWECFQRRQQLQREQGTFIRNAIVPVVWNPLRSVDIPSPYRDIQYTHQDYDPDYPTLGLRGLHRSGRHPTFRKVAYQLALEIVDVAVSARLEPCDPSEFDDLFDALKVSGPAGEDL